MCSSMGSEEEDRNHLDELRRKTQIMSNEELLALSALLKRRGRTTPEEMDVIARQMAQNDAARIRRSRQD